MGQTSPEIIKYGWLFPFVITLSFLSFWLPCARAEQENWKAGIASAAITPDESGKAPRRAKYTICGQKHWRWKMSRAVAWSSSLSSL